MSHQPPRISSSVAHAVDFSTSPSEIYDAYSREPARVLQVVERLVAVGGFDEILRILARENEGLVADLGRLRGLLAAIDEGALELKRREKLEPFIAFFIDLAAAAGCTYESFAVAKTVSSLVAKNTRFPSRALAARYFRCLAAMFRAGDSFYNYVNSLCMLDVLEEVAISAEELAYLRGCCRIKRERGMRRVFCGLKLVDPEEAFENKKFAGTGFVPDAGWERLLAIKKSDAPAAYDVEFLSFLRKNGIAFSVEGGRVAVGDYVQEGFETKIYNITREYEVAKPSAEIAGETVGDSKIAGATGVTAGDAKIADATGVVGNRPAESSAAAPPAPEFPDRFTEPHRRFRWHYRHARNVFCDDSLEERNRNRHEAFVKSSAAAEEQRELFAERADVVRDLAQQLQAKIAAEHEADRLEALERQRAEEERREAERQSQMWSNKRAVRASTPAAPRAGHEAPGRSAAYVPPHFKSGPGSPGNASPSPSATPDSSATGWRRNTNN